MQCADRNVNDTVKILNGDSGVGYDKKKRKKTKRPRYLTSTEEQPGECLRQPSSHSYGQQSARLMPLENMIGSVEKLAHIHEGLSTHHTQKNHDEKDIRKLALQLAITKSSEVKTNKVLHHDYVLVHKTGDNSNVHEKLRKKYERELHDQGFRLDRKYTADKTFVVLHCSFERLCEEAEKVSLEMPLEGYVVGETSNYSLWKRFWDHFKTDDEVDFVSAPFCVSKSHLYEGINNPDTFFRPALRSLLVHHILTDMDIRDKESRQLGHNAQGLGYMLLEGAYTDAFILHERSLYDTQFPPNDNGDDSSFLHSQDIADPRKALHDTWLKHFRYQPLWKIRNYFGEKIALYFGWLGLLTSSLIIPMLLGFAVFLWGLVVGIKDNPLNEERSSTSSSITLWAKNSFDNEVTPFFALIICLWGTIFLETWKRENARLSYQWDVDTFEEQQPNRPQYYGTVMKRDPVTGEEISFYPFIRRFFKMSGSFGIMLFMICLVLGSVVAVIIYRVIAREDLFKERGATGPLLASVTSTFINTLSIMIMGKLYQKLAVILTDWENHRTQTSYEDALIIKLFGFQFVNSYTSLFYIAFFRQNTKDSGVINKGKNYSDECGENNDCMTLLSLQVAMLMIMKPLPKLFTDVIKPWLKSLWKKRKCCNSNKVENGGERLKSLEDYLEHERTKEPLGDFTLSEYNEKVLQYGFLMLFTAAFPLAPLIALLTNAIDMKVDARRLLWTNRRPVAFRAEDIGMWYSILEFLNVAGVVTNSFLVAFTSSYGRSWEGDILTTNRTETVFNNVTNTSETIFVITEHIPAASRLWLIIGFEHIVFTVKFLIAYVIPDTPADVKMALSREKFHVSKILSKAGVRKGPGNKLAESASSFKSRESEDSAVNGSTEVKSTGSGNRLLDNGFYGDQQGREKLKVVVQGASSESSVGRHHRSQRLQPLPEEYLSKQSRA
ncbi:anoctamin-7-like [Acropora palmata]|uniref:anoctamin-7-like n=1 Tax=Acropora palmata TaxID=6131 RepID=UPI003DA02B11